MKTLLISVAVVIVVYILWLTVEEGDTTVPSGGDGGEGSTALSDGLDNFMQAIHDHEGPGLRDQNNNPGNLTAPSESYWNGQTGLSNGKFAVFGDVGDGWTALQRDIHTVVTNHPDWNFFQFFDHYAPKSDNNDPRAYAIDVANNVGVDPNTPVSEVVNS